MTNDQRAACHTQAPCINFLTYLPLNLLTTGEAAVGHCYVSRLAAWNLSLRRCRWPGTAQAILCAGNRRRYSGQHSDRGVAVPTEARLLVCRSSARQICSRCSTRGDYTTQCIIYNWGLMGVKGFHHGVKWLHMEVEGLICTCKGRVTLRKC